MARRVLADFDAELLLRIGNPNNITATQRVFFTQYAYRWLANIIPHTELETFANETINSPDDSLTPAVATNLWWPIMLRNLTDGGPPLEPDDKERIEVLTT